MNNLSQWPQRQLSFIINPTAGHPWSSLRRRVHRTLRQIEPSEAEVLWTKRPGQARAWAQARAQEPERVVVAVGGDGTAHDVAAGLMGGQAKLGVLPLGSGNDFAAMLDHPPNIAQGSQQDWMAFYQTAPASLVDVGQVTWRTRDGSTDSGHFINSMGLGLEGAVARTVQSLKRMKGVTRYAAAALWQIIQYRSLPMMLNSPCGTVAETKYTPKLIVAVGNGRRAGGGFVLQPNARIDDGRLDVCWATALSRWQQLRILPAVFRGTHGRFEGVHQAQVEALTIRCDPETSVHLDGEWVTSSAQAVDVRVCPSALKVVGRG